MKTQLQASKGKIPTTTKHNVKILIKTWRIFKEFHLRYKGCFIDPVIVFKDTITMKDLVIRRTANALFITNGNRLLILKELLLIQNQVVNGVKNPEITYELGEYIYMVLHNDVSEIRYPGWEEHL